MSDSMQTMSQIKKARGVSDSVEAALKAYFEAHGEDLPASGLYQRLIREVERPLLTLTLKSVKGNQKKAADILGINRNTLRKKIIDLEIDPKSAA